jgi:cation:H+ antiporter
MTRGSNGAMWAVILGTVALAVPGLALRIGHLDPLGTIGDTLVYGLAIVACAFLLAWAAEAAEVDISAGLATVAVALIAVLPEYAVDMTFAWKAGRDLEFAPFAIANMTGGNRLLIGAAWPAVFFIFWYRSRRGLLRLERGHAVEVIALAAAAIYSFLLPLKGTIALYDTVFLGVIFGAYVFLVGRHETAEPELIGPSKTIGELPTVPRRLTLAALFLFAAGAILASADPFAEGLVHTGEQLGIDRFLLVQWLAPLASEAPEFLFASILAWRGRAAIAMGVVVSSAVNQWTLLVGGLPIAFSLSGATLHGLPLDTRQMEEVLLTAAQCTFAVAVVLSLSISVTEASLLLGLFALQFLIPFEGFRLAMAAGYLLMTAFIVIRQRRLVPGLLRLAMADEEAPHELHDGHH